MEEVGQTCEQVLLLLLLGFVGQHVLSKRPAEVERLEHGVTVACVSKLRKEEREASVGSPVPVCFCFSSSDRRCVLAGVEKRCGLCKYHIQDTDWQTSYHQQQLSSRGHDSAGPVATLF